MSFFRSRRPDNPRCSFCYKEQHIVGKLIQSPLDHVAAYICDECVRTCHSTLESKPGGHYSLQPPNRDLEAEKIREIFQGRWLDHPLAEELLEAIEKWIALESAGSDAEEELASVRLLASIMTGFVESS